MTGNWEITGADKAFSEVLQARLPEQMFDVHMHVYRSDNIHVKSPLFSNGPKDPGVDEWRMRVGAQVGTDRLSGALCTPLPFGELNVANEFAVCQAKIHSGCRATMLVAPEMTRPQAEAYIASSEGLVVGFKPYHVFAKRAKTYDAELGEYLPEWVWQIADAEHMVILLHLVKDDALADPANLRDIRSHAESYPNARLILAHAGRGFHAANTVRGIHGLRGLQNVWFDSSAICEIEALLAILNEFGPRRLMWGSDFPVSEKHGRCVSLGTGFAWLVTDEVPWNDKAFFGQPVQVGLESLAALLTACDQIGLNSEDLRNIFYKNALIITDKTGEQGSKTADLYDRARKIIPGGTQLLSKRPEMFAPGAWPAYASEARGCEIVDLDGKRYIDMSHHGIGACLLGFGDPDVTRAVQRRVALGSFCTLNQPEEVELAELLCEIHPWAERVRYARTGGESMAVAVRIARATTDRSVIAVCGYHGWHDWYLAANLGEDDSLRGHLLPGLDPKGVPRELRGTTVTFNYGDLAGFERLLTEHGDRLAAVVMEPCRNILPDNGFLNAVRDGTHRIGALLVFDEITIGWRLCFGGAHLKLLCEPDIAVFAKSLGNGHPMGAIIGTAAAMEGAHESFISSTYWTEGVGPAAALATVRKMQRVNVPQHITHIGQRLQGLWRDLGAHHGLPLQIKPGIPVLPGFAFNHEDADVLSTVFTTLMLDQGFLAKNSMHLSMAHTDAVVDKYALAVDKAFGMMADAMQNGALRSLLRGEPAHKTFRRLL